jgi:hypothetical protein
MRRFSIVLLLLVAAGPARSDAQVDAAIRALRRDSSLKVRTQAAIVLGQRGALAGVPALREAVAEDRAPAVRIAAVVALSKIGDRAARSTLRLARQADPDEKVRSAAARALAELGPLALAIDEPSGGPSAARGALRDALSRHLRDHGFSVADPCELRLKPALKIEVGDGAGKTVIAVRTSLVVVDGDGRMDMLESSAKASVSGSVPDAKVPAYAARAIDAAARTLAEDLAARLGER